MAFGSFRGFQRYVNKVFDLEERLGRLSDGRIDPVVPLKAVVITWLWAFIRRVPSTQQVGWLLRDARWRIVLQLRPEDGGSPDTAARCLEELRVGEWNELLLELFFVARRTGLLKDDGPFGKRCVIVDLNELFCSEKVHCEKCQVRDVTVSGPDGQKLTVKQYFHQAVLLTWASGEGAWPIGWELLEPGEGELTAALRLLRRLLPRLRGSVDLVLGDALYCCRPFFETVCGAGLTGLAISSRETEMDTEIDLLMSSEPPRQMLGQDVDYWEMESEAWEKDLGRKLRVAHYVRRYPAEAWKHERRELRVVTSASVENACPVSPQTRTVGEEG